MLVRLAIVLILTGMASAQNTITFKNALLDKKVYTKNDNYALIGNNLFIPVELRDTIPFSGRIWAIAKINLANTDTLEIHIWDRVDSNYKVGTVLGIGDSLWIFLSHRDTVHIWLADTLLNIIKQWKTRLYYWLGVDNRMNVYEAELIGDTLLMLSVATESDLYSTIVLLNLKQNSGHWFHYIIPENFRYSVGTHSIVLICDRKGFDSTYIGWLNLDTFSGTLRLNRFFVDKRLDDYGFVNIEDELSSDTVAFVLGLMKGSGLSSNDAVFWSINSSGVGYREVQGSVFHNDLPCGIEYVNGKWVYVSASASKSKLFIDINSTLSGENSTRHKIVYSGISNSNCRTVSYNNNVFVYGTYSREFTLARIPISTDKVCPGYDMETITDSAGAMMRTFQSISTFSPFIDSPTIVVSYFNTLDKRVEKWALQPACLPNNVIIPQQTETEVRHQIKYIQKIVVAKASTLTFTFNSPETMEIFDITGKLIYQAKGRQMAVYLQPGIYIIRSSKPIWELMYN